MKKASIYAKKAAERAKRAGCKRLSFVADIETQKKFKALQEKKGVYENKKMFEMLINEAFQKTA